MSSGKSLPSRQTRSRLTIRIPSSVADQVRRETRRTRAGTRHDAYVSVSPCSRSRSRSRSPSPSSDAVPIKRIRLTVTPPAQSQPLSVIDDKRKRKRSSWCEDVQDEEGDDVMSDGDDQVDDDKDLEPVDKKIRVAATRHDSAPSSADLAAFPSPPSSYFSYSPSPSYIPRSQSTASTVTIEETTELLSSSCLPLSSSSFSSSSCSSSSLPPLSSLSSSPLPTPSPPPSSSLPLPSPLPSPLLPPRSYDGQPQTPEYRPRSPTPSRLPSSVLNLVPSLLPSEQERVTHVISSQQFSAHRSALVALLTQCPETLAKVPGQANPGRYELTSFLGAGAAGLVMKALDRYADTEVALKLVIDSGRSDTHAKWHREVSLLASLGDSSGILEILDIFCHPACTIPSPDDDGTEKSVGAIYAIVTPFYPDCLCDIEERFRLTSPDYRKWLESRPQRPWSKEKTLPALPLAWTRPIFSQLANALADMHAHGVYHGDIKDENALVSVGGRPAIPGDEEESEDESPVDPSTIEAVFCDLGHSRFLRDASPAAQHPIHQSCTLPVCEFRNTAAKTPSELAPRERLSQYGTPAMTPPEMYPNIALTEAWNDYQNSSRKSSSNQRPQGHPTYHDPLPADVWAFGLMLYTMLYGSLPYHISQVFDFSPAKPDKGSPFLPTGTAKCHIPIPTRNAMGETVPKEARELLRGMLATKETDRWPMSDVVANDWVIKKA